LQASKQEWDIRKLLDWAIKYFNTKEIPQPKLSAELLLSSVLGLSRMQLYLNFGYILKEKELVKFKEYILRRLKNEPVQYILKESFFRNLKLYVDRNVLIPRPETELLVDKLLTTLKENKEDILSANKTLNILDIGTGSGNIAISIASEIKNFLVIDDRVEENGSNKTDTEKVSASPGLWHIIATDVEKSAVAIAEKNAKKNLNDSEIKNLMGKHGFEITPSVFYDMKNLLKEYKEKVQRDFEKMINEFHNWLKEYRKTHAGLVLIEAKLKELKSKLKGAKGK